jgi:hypothetical protein
MSTIGAVGGGLLGSFFGPVGAGIGSTLGNAITGGGSDPTVQTTTNTRTSTPYQVRMPSGALVTMYAHGPDQTETTKTGGGMDTGTSISSALNTFGTLAAPKTNTWSWDELIKSMTGAPAAAPAGTLMA